MRFLTFMWGSVVLQSRDKKGSWHQSFLDGCNQPFVIRPAHETDADKTVSQCGEGGAVADHHPLSDEDIKEFSCCQGIFGQTDQYKIAVDGISTQSGDG